MIPALYNERDFEIVYNIFPFAAEHGLYLLNAFIVKKDKMGELAHIQQRATRLTVESYGEPLPEVHMKVLDMLEYLSPKYLQDHFNAGLKKVVALEKLLEDEKTRPLIQKFVHNRVDKIFQLALQHRMVLSWDIEKKALVRDFLLQIPEEPLEPQLRFTKTDKGVNYQFKLGKDGQYWSISSRKEVIPVTNRPAWLLVDDVLYRVEELNGNLVKPFQKKDEVFVPEKSVKTYFEQFILKVAAKADVEAEGFEITTHNKLLSTALQVTRDLFDHSWGVTCILHYEGSSFLLDEPRPQRLQLSFDSDGQINIQKVLRDPVAEKIVRHHLRGFGLVQQKGNAYLIPVEDPLSDAAIAWVVEQKPRLEDLGFSVIEPWIEERKVNLHKPTLQLEANSFQDWFDIYGLIRLGDFQIPFLQIAKNIRANDPYFILPDDSVFIIPAEWMERYKGLAQFGKQVNQKLRLSKSQFTLLEDLTELQGEDILGQLDRIEFEPSAQLKADLRPYQMEGVKWLIHLYNHKLGACLADDMGLGKTLQTIAALLYVKEKNGERSPAELQQDQQLELFQSNQEASMLNALNSIIILPASLIFNWESEIRKFAPSLTVYKHVGARRHKDVRLLVRFDIILISYQTVLKDIELLKKIDYEYVILDESQQIKNKDSKIFRVINELQARHKISLSGTPIENSLSDLWAQMQFINPQMLGSYNFFKKHFIQPIEKHRDEEKRDQLKNLVKPYLLRRTKEEVAKELPSLTASVCYAVMDAEQKKLYEKEKSQVRNEILEHLDTDSPQQKILILQSLTKLRQLANHPALVYPDYDKESSKFSEVMSQWETIKKSNHKVLIFSSFVQHLNLFRQAMDGAGDRYAWLSGDLSGKQREEQVRLFQEDPKVQAFLISIKSGGTGLNLTAADYVFILDPWWNPFIEQQAIARAHRIGQERNVFAQKFITKDTIEEKILQLQEKKTLIASDVIENASNISFNREELNFLLD
ncbi:MAG: DEAD/DEAH box helicase [Saprospiraceae bacterium]|jgi:superfamily II DNA or RNA helicase|nr:DEAD/DEAH box helicase [Saprospiraceae bacterium]